ncbi:hypothetical protein COO91_09948 (plasmid) [Nostoc flagelliforme CCNUN1]|uniref:Uncharacterized protein n=1 Tax=Nostoc flagelliforme CCNUN1 TaxID=2038116 RepID=A0A2K8T7U0_9NOSO|nr:hypothetical protein COO91_09948 [Nostoc flagelliforme CCNUN1]
MPGKGFRKLIVLRSGIRIICNSQFAIAASLAYVFPKW